MWSGLIEQDVYSILENVDRPLVKKALVRWIGGRSVNAFDGRNDNDSEEALRCTMRALDDQIKLLVPKAYQKLSEMRIGGRLIEQLSRLEAEVVNRVCKIRSSAEPIHDCVLCSIDDRDDLTVKFSAIFEEVIGISPVLTNE